MTALRCGAGESLLQTCERAEAEAETYVRVQSGHDQTELGHGGGGNEKREGREENQVQQPGRQRSKKGG